MPFENVSGKPEFNWVGESFADSLADLLGSKEVRATRLNVVPNEERKIVQQRLNIPLTSLPSLATSLKLARETGATLMVVGNFSIETQEIEKGKTVPVAVAKARIIGVNKGAFITDTDSAGVPLRTKDNKIEPKEIVIKRALTDLQSIQGEITYQILYLRDKQTLPFSQNQFIEMANKIPSRAFEAYIKGLLTPDSDPQSKEGFFKNAMRLYAEAKTGEDVTEADKVYADAALELGHFYLNRRDFQNAVDYFSKIPQTDSHYAEAAFYTGLIRWQQNDYEQALAVLRPLAEDLKLTSVYNTIGAISVQAARAEKKNKGKSDAFLKDGLEFLKKAAESAPDDQTSARFNYGLALFLNGSYAEAAEQLKPVLAANPNDGEAFYLLGKSYKKMNDEANAAFNDNQARRLLSNYAKIETDFQKTNSPDDVNLRVEQPPRKDFVSVVLSRQKSAPQIQTAVNETDELLAQAKDFYKGGRDDDAMQVLRRIQASDPMNAEAYLLFGNIYLRRGDLENAVSSLKTALFWNNQLIDANISLGKIFLEKKDCAQAQTYSQSALAIDANNEQALALQRSVERCGK
ncbi:MAG: tetratricopeptide repeat protein [Pyrinomonadaceae bacterium]